MAKIVARILRRPSEYEYLVSLQLVDGWLVVKWSQDPAEAFRFTEEIPSFGIAQACTASDTARALDAIGFAGAFVERASLTLASSLEPEEFPKVNPYTLVRAEREERAKTHEAGDLMQCMCGHPKKDHLRSHGMSGACWGRGALSGLPCACTVFEHVVGRQPK